MFKLNWFLTIANKVVIFMTDETKPKLIFGKLKFGKWDILAIAALAGFIILMAALIYAPKGGCEVARAGFACVPAKDVLIENCNYMSKWNCDSSKDASLPDIEFEIQSLCKIQNNLHGTGLDCSNVKMTCNQITQKQVC